MHFWSEHRPLVLAIVVGFVVVTIQALIWTALRTFTRTASERLLLALAGAWVAAALWYGSNALVEPAAGLALAVTAIGWMWLATTDSGLKVVDRVVAWAALRSAAGGGRESLVCLVMPVAVTLALANSFLCVGLGARVWLSEVALLAHARDVLEGRHTSAIEGPPSAPAKTLGLFDVAGGEVHHGCAYLQTCSAFPERGGLVYAPGREPPGRSHTRIRPLFGPWWSWHDR